MGFRLEQKMSERCGQVIKDDLAAHVRERLEKELVDKERARKEKEESHLYTIIKVARDSDLRAQIGSDLFFDLVDHDKAGNPGYPL